MIPTEEITEGLKMTDIGPLPKDWQTRKLHELFEIQQGKALSQKHKKGISPHPFLRTANVFWGRIDLVNVDWMDFSSEEINKLGLRAGDLLVCEGGDIGRTAIWDGSIDKCCYQNHLHRLRPINDEAFPLFYMYWMQAAMLILGLYIGTGNKTTIPNLSRGRLAEYLLPLPSLSEQRKIAFVLSVVQEAKQKTENVIAALKELKKSMMKHLFTYGPVSIEEAPKVPLKETEIGAIPTHWSIAPIEKMITLSQYGLSVRGNQKGKHPILRMNAIQDGRLDLSDLQYVDIDNVTYEKFKLNKGDVLFNRTNSYELVGKAALVETDSPMVFASYLVRVVPDDDQLLPEFLNYFLNWQPTQNRLKMLASRGVSQSNINATKLKGFPISLPQLPEQREISNILSAIDKKIDAEKTKKKALEAVFKTLLSLLMTGKLRVKDLEIPA